MSQLKSPLLQTLASLPVPIMAAPMFLVSGPQLLSACCLAGVIGSLPAPNARTVAQLDDWLAQIEAWLGAARLRGETPAPWLLNMIVHSSYDRFDAELELVRRYQPPLVSTALGSPNRVIDTVHGYGGQVLADVINPAMARKAVAAGVDGLVLVCHGAGGHTGSYNPFAFIAEVREFWDGPLGVAGAISNGRDVHAVQVLGADFAVVGTRFIAAEESLVSNDYRLMLSDCGMDDLVASKAVSGVLANWLRPSLLREQIDPSGEASAAVDFSGDIASANKAWKDVWSAGHGVGQVKATTTAAQLVAEFEQGYRQSLDRP
ncbi:MAG: nitronate monooxygenase, partial [Pseudomonas sp.]